MRYPQNIKTGGTIGFVAPSFGCAIQPYRAAFDNSIEKWHKKGYITKLGPNCYASDGIGISSSPVSCGEELTQFYVSEDTDVLMSCGGGELMCETVSHVDFDRIKAANPKWFMGYSDNTNFTFLLNTIADVASVYGPCAAAFGTEEEHRSLEDAFRLISTDECEIHFEGYDRWQMTAVKDEEHPLAGYNLDMESVVKAYECFDDTYAERNSVRMHGRLTGGCLDCLVNLCGTRFDKVEEFNSRYKDDGIIWFLESCDLNVMSIRRAMWELEEAGWFNCVSGFLIGRPLHFGEDMMGLDQYRAVLDVIAHHHVPVIMDADIGHLPPMLPLISGSVADVAADNGKWNITMQKL